MILPIPGYEGLYSISTEGDVFSMRHGRFRTQNKDGMMKKRTDRGYHTVRLQKHGVLLYTGVHRLVALSFIPNQENKPQVNHINGIKTDNMVENLERVTASENEKHSRKILGKKNSEKQRQSAVLVCKRKSIAIVQYTLKGEPIRERESLAEAKRMLGVNNIAACLKGRRNKAGGYIWKYKNDT